MEVTEILVQVDLVRPTVVVVVLHFLAVEIMLTAALVELELFGLVMKDLSLLLVQQTNKLAKHKKVY